MGKTYNSWGTPLSLLKLIGLYSETKTKKMVVFATLYDIMLLFLNLMFLIQFPTIKGDIFEYIDNAEAIGAFSQVFGKIAVAAYQNEKLIKILQDTKRFWKTDVCPYEIKKKLDELTSNIVRFQKLYLYCIVVGTCIVELGSILSGALPLGSWNIQGYDFLRKLTLVSDLIIVPIIAIFIISFDTLFLSLCAETAIQFRILYCCIKELSVSDAFLQDPEKEYYIKVKSYIQHHIFLLRFSEHLQDYYSAALLIQYITISPLICIEMYCLFEGENVQFLAKHGTLCVCVLIQLAFYCVTADFISSEALAVCDAMYDSDWYSRYFTTSRSLITLLIQRSQRRVLFTAGGLIEINIRTLLVVLRASWSGCTLMRALKRNR